MRISVLPWIAAITALVVAGCATSPPLPRIEATKGDRIGIIVDVGDSPSHTHIGTTVFNNFAKKYPFNWNMSAEVRGTIEQSVKNAGLTPINLQAEGIHYADVAGLIQTSGEKWQVATGKDNTIRRLRDQLRLKAVFVLKESRVVTALECAGGPCSERYADASGLYTRSFFGLTRYNAVAAYQWNVFVLDPVADIAKADPLSSILRIPATPLPGFKEPANFENLTEVEFSPVRDSVLRFTAMASAEAVRTLNVK
jgi:hypothetical protein